MRNIYKIYAIAISSFLLFSFSLYIKDCNAQWIPLNYGFTGSQANGLASIGSTVFVSSNGYGVFFSPNNGLTWTAVNSGLTNLNVNAIVTSGNNLYAGTGGGGVFLSTNNGGSWTSGTSGMTYLNVLSLIAVGANLFAGTSGGGVFRSTNNGSSWTVVNSGIANYTIFSFAASGTNIYANSGTAIYYSSNNGTNWSNINNNIGDNNIRSVYANGNNLLAGTLYSGVFSSTNNGLIWMAAGLTSIFTSCFVSNGNHIFAGTSGGVFLTTNFGANWESKNQGFTSIPSVYSLYNINNFIFAGTSSKVWRRDSAEINIGIKQISESVPSSYSLKQNYPNPFNPTTKITFNVARMSDVKIVVYDIMGREVQSLVNEKLQPGTYETTFDGSQFTSGVYYYRLTTEDFVDTKKMLMIK